MPNEPRRASDTLYGCPECAKKAMELIENVDGTMTFRCSNCNHEQGRGQFTSLFMGGVQYAV